MNLYRVKYREWNTYFSDMYKCEELSVGKNKEEAINRVKEVAAKDARFFKAEKITTVFGHKVLFDDNMDEQRIESKVVNNGQIIASVDNEDNSIDIAVNMDDEPLVTLNISVNDDMVKIRKWIGDGDSIDEHISIDDICEQESDSDMTMQ